MIERHHVHTSRGARRAAIVATEDLIFFSGIRSSNSAGDANEQARDALSQVDELLAELDEDQRSILMIHVWLKDMRYFGAMNSAWNAWADPENPPARTCVSGELAEPDQLVEFVVTAYRTRRVAS